MVRRIIEAAKTDIKGLIGNTTALRALSPKNFVDETFGLPTVTDILRELEKPGRDPRPAFKAAVFADGVETLDDLKPGMVLEGAVTNVAAFGAFVDIGVHQDGLVHISAMSKTFVKDPRAVVKPGDIVRVKVLEVDKPRKRIALTLRLDDEVGARGDRAGTPAPRNDNGRPPSRARGPRATRGTRRRRACRCSAPRRLGGETKVAPNGGPTDRGQRVARIEIDQLSIVRIAGPGQLRRALSAAQRRARCKTMVLADTRSILLPQEIVCRNRGRYIQFLHGDRRADVRKFQPVDQTFVHHVVRIDVRHDDAQKIVDLPGEAPRLDDLRNIGNHPAEVFEPLHRVARRVVPRRTRSSVRWLCGDRSAPPGAG